MSLFASAPSGDRSPAILDGGGATELQKRGLALGEPAELWNLTRPDAVEAVARSYIEAGGQIVLTNTFQANPAALGRFGRANDAAAINRQAARISRRAVGSSGALVFGSIGPASDLDRAAFAIQARALADGGVDALVLETFSILDEARLALGEALKTGLRVVVSFHFDHHSGAPSLFSGESPEEAARAMTDAGAAAVGANCGAGPDEFEALCRRLKSATNLPVWLKPSAGIPTIHNGRLVYPATPEAFAARRAGWVAAGASFLGGCCGTTPEFIRALTN